MHDPLRSPTRRAQALRGVPPASANSKRLLALLNCLGALILIAGACGCTSLRAHEYDPWVAPYNTPGCLPDV